MLIARCPNCESDWRVSAVEAGARCPNCQSPQILYQSILGKTVRIQTDGVDLGSDENLQDISPGKESIPQDLRVTLTVEKGENKGSIFELHRSRTTFGRGAADIDVHDPHSSRRHFAIEIHGHDSIRLKDLISTNGTFVNGDRLQEAPLKDGDVIGLGDTELVLRVERTSGA